MFEIGLGLLAHRGRQVEITSPTERQVCFDLVGFYHNESQLFGADTLKQGSDRRSQDTGEPEAGF